MKNLLHNILVGMTLALFMASIQSCANDSEEMNLSEVSFTATLPVDAHSRSFGKAKQVNTLVVGVFNEDQEEIDRYFLDINGTSIHFSIALAQHQTYNLIFWAYDDCQDIEIYDIEYLTAIRMNALPASITFSQAEAMDAFFATHKNMTVTSDKSYTIELVRPLAQINVGTTGIPMQASFTAKAVPYIFYPFSNTVAGTTDFTWDFSETTAETFSADGKKYNYLAMGYVFAPTSVIPIATELILTDGEQSLAMEFPQVEIEANKRSNIAGRFTRESIN